MGGIPTNTHYLQQIENKKRYKKYIYISAAVESAADSRCDAVIDSGQIVGVIVEMYCGQIVIVI